MVVELLSEKGLKWAPRMSDWPRYLEVVVNDRDSNRGVRRGGRVGEKGGNR